VAEVEVVVVVGAVVVMLVLVPAVVPVAALRHRDPNRVRLGPLFTTRGQGASPCGRSRGLFLRLVPRWPCSLVHSRGSPRRRLSIALDSVACRFIVAHAARYSIAGYSTVWAG
jgi:ribosomal protein S18 acetylase RimI-like enzyme